MTLASPHPQPTLIRTGIPTKGSTSLRKRNSAAVPHKHPIANTSYLAHDARNWMTVLQVYCDLLRTPGAVADGYQTWMEELSGAVERGHLLLGSLLDSIEGGDARTAEPMADILAPAMQPGIRLDARPLDLAAALTRRLPLLRQLAGNTIQVEICAPLSTGKVALSESAFERILHNLVGNAMEAMPEGGRLRIAIRAAKRCGNNGLRPVKTLLLCIEDTGTGIDPRHLPCIFEAGVSSKHAHASHPERRGFGLAIVRELAQSAGGKVRVRSHPGRGSCFEVELPQV